MAVLKTRLFFDFIRKMIGGKEDIPVARHQIFEIVRNIVTLLHSIENLKKWKLRQSKSKIITEIANVLRLTVQMFL